MLSHKHLLINIFSQNIKVRGLYCPSRNYRNLVKYYTNKNIGVSLLRAKKKNDTDRVMSLYGNESERYW
ncbi:hypothetical protein D0T84_01305 [Dysgonomonas sp. 521]|nr:hypothetical protein [Dysgonomonas sp. 521]